MYGDGDRDTGPTSGRGWATTYAQPSEDASGSGVPKPPRRASLQLKHVRPWSTFKTAVGISVALYVLWLAAWAAIYGILGALGLWSQINHSVGGVLMKTGLANGPLITFGHVMVALAVIGAVGIIVMVLAATILSWAFNVASGLVGGLITTLTDRDR